MIRNTEQKINGKLFRRNEIHNKFKATRQKQIQMPMKIPHYYQPDPSFTDLSYTYAFDKYSCVSWVYPFHIVFAYLVVLMGFLAALSRVVKRMTPYHAAFGRWYIIFMLWTMSSSLLIHNAGLPLPILVSFLYLLFSIMIGWSSIRIHVNKLTDELKERVQLKVNALIAQNSKVKLDQIQQDEKHIILKSRTLGERLCSWKMLHGILMAFSWAQMLGRTFVTNPFNSFSGCWTYPAYKSSHYDGQAYAVDSISTPPFPMPTGLFIIIITVPTVIIILFIAFCSTYCFYRSEKKEVSKGPQFESNTI